MWTVFDATNRPVANVDFEPNRDELALREEQAIYHEEYMALEEVMLVGASARKKPLLVLTGVVLEQTATITVACEEAAVTEVPLTINGTAVLKPIGDFRLTGEPGLKVMIDFARETFRGEQLEVEFGG